jgi:hypothetical protein
MGARGLLLRRISGCTTTDTYTRIGLCYSYKADHLQGWLADRLPCDDTDKDSDSVDRRLTFTSSGDLNLDDRRLRHVVHTVTIS